VRADNGRIAVAYNEDGFDSTFGYTLNLTLNRNGFIVSINEDGSCGARYNRTELEDGAEISSSRIIVT
jgi:hypothetical protein